VLGHLPENVHLISHVHPKGALYEPAPQPTARAHNCAAWVVWRDGDRPDILDSVATIS
jgi:hypothetical protein